MFGPNNKPKIHHREKDFEDLMVNLQNQFKETFNISDDFIVLPITGSGTLALEMLINGLDINFDVLYSEDEFGSRLKKLNRNKHKKLNPKGVIFAQYETSISKLNSYKPKDEEFVIIDAVSSFPYYDIPEYADAWVTVNSKQIGCNPGLSFIVLNKRILPYVKEEEFSYLSLGRNIEFFKKNQTPNTPAIGLMIETFDTLKIFNVEELRAKINYRRLNLSKLLPNNIGDGPTYTLLEVSSKLKVKFNLYGRLHTQLFLWTGEDNQYTNLFNYLKGNK